MLSPGKTKPASTGKVKRRIISQLEISQKKRYGLLTQEREWVQHIENEYRCIDDAYASLPPYTVLDG